MKKKMKNFALLGLISALSLAGCSNGGGGDDDDDQQNTAAVLNYIFSTDHEGYINIFEHRTDNTTERVAAFQPLNSTGGTLALGEIHIAHGKAFVIIQSGLTDAMDNEIGGGLAVVNTSMNMVEDIISMPTTLTQGETGGATTSRFVHTYMDPSGNYLWMNNDGVTATAADSVFRININPMDMDDSDGDKYQDFTEILVDNGHKKSALAYPTDGGAPAMKLFVTHNLTEESISIIDNDHMSPDFLTVIKTVDFGDAGDNTFHGMAFSTVSGHVYAGATRGVDVGLAVIDATDAALPESVIPAGMDMGANEIPGGGYVKTTHDGRWVMTAGFTGGNGYLSVIDAQTDTVTSVVNLGPIASSSFNIAEMEMDMGGGATMHHVKVFVPSRIPFGPPVAGINTTQVAVLDFNPMTGEAGPTPRYVYIGEGTSHRNGKTSKDGMLAYYPAGGDCGASHDAHGDGCYLISVVDVMSETVIAEMHTAGHEPGSMKVISSHDLTGVGPGDGGGGHMH